MADSIQLQLDQIPVPLTTDIARSPLSIEQVQAFITLLSSTTPPLIVLPSGKGLTDVANFNIHVLSDGTGNLTISF